MTLTERQALRDLARCGLPQPVRGSWHDPVFLGKARRTASFYPELAGRVCRALKLAGFHVVDEADDTALGLKVGETPMGVLVSWMASHGFTALAADQRAASGDGIRMAVRAAVAGLLSSAGTR
ncbi:hypothetical protein ABZ923_33825 [Streptomyces sp. NPDC046881]|uniref:hypothetical protein n=1 Tax=Streptomyces sp. NPDC046881 TaxID=3155374 RepID=UPI0033F3B56B